MIRVEAFDLLIRMTSLFEQVCWLLWGHRTKDSSSNWFRDVGVSAGSLVHTPPPTNRTSQCNGLHVVQQLLLEETRITR